MSLILGHSYGTSNPPSTMLMPFSNSDKIVSISMIYRYLNFKLGLTNGLVFNPNAAWSGKLSQSFTKAPRFSGSRRGLGNANDSDLNLHIWNANWPMKSEAKMAAHEGQFWTSVSVSYAGLYASFSLQRDFLHFYWHDTVNSISISEMLTSSHSLG